MFNLFVWPPCFGFPCFFALSGIRLVVNILHNSRLKMVNALFHMGAWKIFLKDEANEKKFLVLEPASLNSLRRNNIA